MTANKSTAQIEAFMLDLISECVTKFPVMWDCVSLVAFLYLIISIPMQISFASVSQSIGRAMFGMDLIAEVISLRWELLIRFLNNRTDRIGGLYNSVRCYSYYYKWSIQSSHWYKRLLLCFSFRHKNYMKMFNLFPLLFWLGCMCLLLHFSSRSRFKLNVSAGSQKRTIHKPEGKNESRFSLISKK